MEINEFRVFLVLLFTVLGVRQEVKEVRKIDAQLEEELEKVNEKIKQELQQVDEKLEKQVEKELDKIDRRVERQVEKKLQKVDEKLGKQLQAQQGIPPAPLVNMASQATQLGIFVSVMTIIAIGGMMLFTSLKRKSSENDKPSNKPDT